MDTPGIGTLELIQSPEQNRAPVIRPPWRFHPRWMYCQLRNASAEPIFIYGRRHESEASTRSTSIFILEPRMATPSGWDCKGILIPSERSATDGRSLFHGPIALKYWYMRRVSIEVIDGRYHCPRCNGLILAEQSDWSVPVITYSELLSLPRRIVRV